MRSLSEMLILINDAERRVQIFNMGHSFAWSSVNIVGSNSRNKALCPLWTSAVLFAPAGRSPTGDNKTRARHATLGA